ncbi:MAG TPA: divalent-cation tolerance protein CutA [Caldimonas sp.]|jgi:periplasmic divalent cation tolerance protein|nr:divalent-cation tolerance protein CutA [Caldimonas sp.]HEX4234298.1 divalent-cation tolerance protein CutA [Caldimonas sp.]
MAPLLLVVTTVGDRDEAGRLAHTLVERGLAACAQISSIDSVYAWQGRVEQGAEFRVLFKIAPGAYDAVEQAIRELHSYELPAIHAIPVERAWEPYRAWVEANSRATTTARSSQRTGTEGVDKV